jgi:hypothetical protein
MTSEAPKTLKDAFRDIAISVWPSGTDASKCGLTRKKFVEFERMFFAGARVMQSAYLHTGFQSQEEAVKAYTALEDEIASYMKETEADDRN